MADFIRDLFRGRPSGRSSARARRRRRRHDLGGLLASRAPRRRHGLGLESLEQRAMLAIDMEFVTVGSPANAADQSTGGIYGTVAAPYRLGTYEVTIGQYAEFLSAVASEADPYGLYNASMGTNRNVAGILQTPVDGGFAYSILDPAGTNPADHVSAADRPITFVSWFDAARFANWMANGQPSGGQTTATTEDGAYPLAGGTSGTPPARNATNPNTGLAVTYWLPTEDQWYKAAFYDPAANAGAGGYVSYATASSTAPGSTLGAAANQANYRLGGNKFSLTQSTFWSSGQNYLSDVGAFTGSASPQGTFDQSGNVWEWTDFVVYDDQATTRAVRGGGWTSNATQISKFGRLDAAATQEYRDYGFRLASAINNPPEAVTLANVATSLPENTDTTAAIKVADIQITDDALGINTITLSGPDATRFTVIDKALYLTGGTSLDYETQASYTVTVSVADLSLPGTSPVTVAYSLSVTYFNEAPTTVALGHAYFATSLAPGGLVTELSTTDDDAGDSHTYTLVTGEGDTDNTRFTISGNTLVVADDFSALAGTTFSIRLRTTDSGGLSFETPLTLTAVDLADYVPTNLRVMPGTIDGELWAAWELRAGAIAAAMTDYRVQVSATNGATWIDISDGVSVETAAAVDGLDASTSYVLRVAADVGLATAAWTAYSAAVVPVSQSFVEFVHVGHPGNAPDPRTGNLYGAVDYQYRIGKYEITIGQYAEFLNAVAKSDPFGL